MAASTKKGFCVLGLFLGIAGLVFAQKAPRQSIDDLVNMLNDNFATYHFITIVSINITDDISAPFVNIARLPYERGRGTNGVVYQAEFVHIEMVQSGNRYNIALDFYDASRIEKNSFQSPDGKRRVFNVISSLIPQQKQTQDASSE